MIRYQPYRVCKIDNGTESIFQRSEDIVKILIKSMNKKIKNTNIFPMTNYKTYSSGDLFLLPSKQDVYYVRDNPKEPIDSCSEIEYSDTWKYEILLSIGILPCDVKYSKEKKNTFVKNPLEVKEPILEYNSYHLYTYKRSRLFENISKEYYNLNSKYTVFPIKITEPGHITIALYYPDKGLLEYFDTYGAKFKKPRWENGEPINPRYPRNNKK